ncbi:hypothetical protein [Arthrobacter sp. R-11]|uniref:hypothetical protein n=1 Tax=Arthrobacter sp. R-11 TaxID=3404053 RepID=UPI003CF88E67
MTVQLDPYFREIKRPAQIADCFVAWLEGARSQGNITAVFAAAQGLLSASVAVSRILWPDDYINKKVLTREQSEALPGHRDYRSQALRTTLAADDFRDLLADRDVRNAFEHFDQRMDLHLMGGKPIVDFNVGMPEFIDAPFNTLRLFDDVRNDLAILGNTINLKQLYRAMKELSDRAEAHQTNLAQAADNEQEARKPAAIVPESDFSI